MKVEASGSWMFCICSGPPHVYWSDIRQNVSFASFPLSTESVSVLFVLLGYPLKTNSQTYRLSEPQDEHWSSREVLPVTPGDFLTDSDWKKFMKQISERGRHDLSTFYGTRRRP